MNAVTRVIGWVPAMLVVTGAAMAQEDYRHLDQDRPLRVEDAYPIKFLEWEWEIGASGSATDGGEYEGSGVLEMKVGIFRNVQFGVEVHGEVARAAGVTARGAEAFGAHLLYNLNQESLHAPAVAVRADLSTPGTGDVGREDWGARLKGIVTRSFGATRTHLNAAHTWAAALDGGNLWSGGLAVDRPLGLTGRAVMGDVFVEAPAAGGDARVWTEVGMRIQAGLATVIDVGVGTRVDEWADGRANVAVTFGLSRVFGVGGVVRVPPYPNPRIN